MPRRTRCYSPHTSVFTTTTMHFKCPYFNNICTDKIPPFEYICSYRQYFNQSPERFLTRCLGSSACCRPSFTWATSATRGRRTGTTPSTFVTPRCCPSSPNCWRYGTNNASHPLNVRLCQKTEIGGVRVSHHIPALTDYLLFVVPKCDINEEEDSGLRSGCLLLLHFTFFNYPF